jgi:hypothetical protein
MNNKEYRRDEKSTHIRKIQEIRGVVDDDGPSLKL